MSNERVDLARLKARISVESVLIKAGAVFPGSYALDQEAPFFCPFCEDLGSTKPAGRANEMEGLWHCWACNRGGDIITAAREYLAEIPGPFHAAGFNEALEWLAKTWPEEVVDSDPWADRQGAS